MQGQRGAIGSFSETLGFDHGSGSSDGDQQIFWENNLQNSPTNQQGQGIMWTMGEPGSSSGSNQLSHGPIEPRPDRGWPALSKSCPEPPPPPPSMLQLSDHTSSIPHNLTSNSNQSISDPFDIDNNTRLSRKRKAIGQSSSGSSNLLESSEVDNQNIPRLGLGGPEHSFENPVLENTRRNVQLRIRDPLPGNSALYPSLRLNPVDFRSLPVPTTTMENLNSTEFHHGQPILRIPGLRRNLQSNSRWNRNAGSRNNRLSNLVIPAERNEVGSRSIPSNFSDHPLFAQPTEINWTSNGGAAATAATSQAAPAPLSAPPSHRNPPHHHHHHSRRLSAFLGRTLLSTTDSEAANGLNSNLFPRIIPSSLTGSASSSSSQDLGIPHAAASIHHQAHVRNSSVLVGRQVDFGFPYHSRSMITGSEGRGRLVSEIRNVLDLMRRGEPLRFEDIMILDQSMFYGIADVHDRHRDMRLDIDNMSYEELLALEERIGNVNTGLTEETILKHLKQNRYVAVTGQPDSEPCCVCQEEYKNGDDLGTLECGHEFHHGCIKQWLQHKNSCPICKTAGFNAS